MSSHNFARITNIWSKVVESEAGDLFSRVVIESYGSFQYKAATRDGAVVLEVGAAPNMPEGPVEINDGLVRQVSLTKTGPGAAVVEISLEHPADYKIEVVEGIPVRTTVILERSYLSKIFGGRKIVIDPGHGGDDWGGRGPVNLLEKNVVLPVANNLRKLFEQAGARVVLTRAVDERIAPEDRIKIALVEKADLFISIHTHVDQDCKVGGPAVLYGPSCPGGPVVAELVREALNKKLKLKDRGVGESRDYAVLGAIPAIEVEVVAITNWVEEGLLRSPTVHKKAAEGIFNGVKNYFANIGRG